METNYDKLRSYLRANKNCLDEDGYIQLDKSPLIKVGLGSGGEEIFRKKFGVEFVYADGVQIDKETSHLVVWVSTPNSEIIDKVYGFIISEDYLETIYKEVVKTINNKQTPKTKTPMKEYEINERAILETRAKFMANAKSVEEQEQIRMIADLSATANRELEIERLLTKFGTRVNVMGGVRAAFIKDNRDNDLTLLLIHGDVFIVKGDLVDTNMPKPFHEFDAESQAALLTCFKSDIKEKLTAALEDARKAGKFMSAIVYKNALEEEFGEE